MNADRHRLPTLAVAVALAAGIVTVYLNSLNVPFVFDDTPAIVENPTIRRLWPIWDVLVPPRGEGLTVEGRPLVNLTLALNYAIGGTSVRGYHVFNIGVHVLTALALLGVVRRTLKLPRLNPRFGDAALPLAGIVAFLWALHPLQTESVTYVIQRAEALVGLFYLLTIYCFIRAVEWQLTASGTSARSRGWDTAAVVACALGMATKEVMVSAPLIVLLHDRAIVSGSFRSAWCSRPALHSGLFATWILLAMLVVNAGTRGGTAGFGIDITPWAYALTQFEAVTRYLTLCFWPHPLIFDYGVAWVESWSEVLPHAVVLGTLIGATIVAWWRWPVAALLGIFFFAVLSPTSSFVPGNRQTLAEHRMYLPLAAVIALVVCSGYAATRRPLVRRALAMGVIAVAVAFGLLTARRNRDYQSEVVLYRDTVDKRPKNGFARYNLAKAYAEAGRHSAALAEYAAALAVMGDLAGVHYNLANSLAALGQREEAIKHYEAAIRVAPRYGRAHLNLGNLLVQVGRKEAAAEHFAAAVAAEPEFIEARVNHGGVLLELGRLAEARHELEHVLQRDPHHVIALFNLGNVCLFEQRWPEAIQHFEKVIAFRPDLGVARERLQLARSRGK